LGIRDETFDLQLPTVADVEIDLVNFASHLYSPSVSPATCAPFAIHRFRLDPIISEIKLLFYHLPSRVSVYVWPHDVESSQASIGIKLKEWRNTLNEITISSQYDEDDSLEQERHKLKLTSQYYSAMVLLHQPSQAIPHPSEQSILTCYECAAERLNTYYHLYQLESYVQSWRSVQGIFSSGATMIYCLWSSCLVRQTVPTSVAMRDLRTCTNLLTVGGEFWPSVKKGKESFIRAMDALARKLEQLQPQQWQRYDSRSMTRLDTGHNDEVDLERQPIHGLSGQAVGVDHVHTTLQGQHGLTDFQPEPVALDDTDWAAFGDNTFIYNEASNSNALFETMQQAPEATVEAFITEFLNSDTAWNHSNRAH
jgi:hypothetical protein